LVYIKLNLGLYFFYNNDGDTGDVF
jgi:hypothetical protein